MTTLSAMPDWVPGAYIRTDVVRAVRRWWQRSAPVHVMRTCERWSALP
jgi:hypothetical protein